MGSSVQEALLPTHRLPHTLEQEIEFLDDGSQLSGEPKGLEGLEIMRLAARDLVGKAEYGPDGPPGQQIDHNLLICTET